LLLWRPPISSRCLGDSARPRLDWSAVSAAGFCEKTHGRPLVNCVWYRHPLRMLDCLVVRPRV